jgi:hypothetical protein
MDIFNESEFPINYRKFDKLKYDMSKMYDHILNKSNDCISLQTIILKKKLIQKILEELDRSENEEIRGGVRWESWSSLNEIIHGALKYFDPVSKKKLIGLFVKKAPMNIYKGRKGEFFLNDLNERDNAYSGASFIEIGNDHQLIDMNQWEIISAEPLIINGTNDFFGFTHSEESYEKKSLLEGFYK